MAGHVTMTSQKPIPNARLDTASLLTRSSSGLMSLGGGGGGGGLTGDVGGGGGGGGDCSGCTGGTGGRTGSSTLGRRSCCLGAVGLLGLGHAKEGALIGDLPALLMSISSLHASSSGAMGSGRLGGITAACRNMFISADEGTRAAAWITSGNPLTVGSSCGVAWIVTGAPCASARMSTRLWLIGWREMRSRMIIMICS